MFAASSPFKFLDSYTKEDKDIFFGREQEIEELYTKIFRSRLLLVYGLSGTGKSSLIQCGLGNKFNDSDWLPINIRRSGDMITSLWNGLSKYSLTPLKELKGQITPAQFKKGIQSLYLDHFKPVYLIFDQFEELFIFGREEERKHFVDLVAAAISSDIQCKFIFVIREEYLANLTEFEYDLPELFSNRIRIEKMSRLKALDVIEKPCKVFGIEVEDKFAENLLNKISPEKNEIELTYLQVYLDKLYKIAEKQRKNTETPIRFTNKMLDDTGSITDLLGSFLEEQIAQLPNPEHALTLLKSFVSTQGTKRQINLEEIRNNARTLGKDLEEKEITNLVTRFTDLRILRDKDESGRYELRHDALAAKIYEKITLVEKELMEIRQFIENAHQNYLRRKISLSQQDLHYIAPYEDKIFLPDELAEFIAKCKNEITKKKKRQRLLFSVSGLLIISSLIVYSIYSYKNSRILDSERLATTGLLNLSNDPTLSFLLGEKAYELSQTSLSKKTLFHSFSERNFYDVILGERLESSKDGKMVFTYNYLGNEINYNNLEISEKKIIKVSLPDSFGLSTVTTFGNYFVCNIINKRVTDNLKLHIGAYSIILSESDDLLFPNNHEKCSWLKVSPSDKFFVVIKDSIQLKVYSDKMNFTSEFFADEKIKKIEFSKNGNFMLAVSDSSAILYDFEKNKWSLLIDSYSLKTNYLRRKSQYLPLGGILSISENNSILVITANDLNVFTWDLTTQPLKHNSFKLKDTLFFEELENNELIFRNQDWAYFKYKINGVEVQQFYYVVQKKLNNGNFIVKPNKNVIDNAIGNKDGVLLLDSNYKVLKKWSGYYFDSFRGISPDSSSFFLCGIPTNPETKNSMILFDNLGNEIFKQEGTQIEDSRFEFSKYGKYIYQLNGNGLLLLTSRGKELITLKVLLESSIFFENNDKFLIAKPWSSDMALCYDIDKILSRFNTDENFTAENRLESNLVYSLDSKNLFWGLRSIWDIKSGIKIKDVKNIEVKFKNYSLTSLVNNNVAVFSSSNNDSIVKYDFKLQKAIQSYQSKFSKVSSFLNTDKLLVWQDSSLVLLDGNLNEIKTYKNVFPNYYHPYMDYLDDKYISFFKSGDRFFKILNFESGEIFNSSDHNRYIFDVNYCEKQKLFLSTGIDSVCKIWDVSGKLLKTIKSRNGPLYTSYMSPDGKFLFLSTATIIYNFDPTTMEVRGVTPTGQQQVIELWDLTRNEIVFTKKLEERINYIRCSPDGKQFYTVSERYGKFRIWRIDGTELFSSKIDYSGYGSSKKSFKISPDGSHIAYTLDDKLNVLPTSVDSILKVVKSEKVFGNIRDFTEEEKKEYRIED